MIIQEQGMQPYWERYYAGCYVFLMDKDSHACLGIIHYVPEEKATTLDVRYAMRILTGEEYSKPACCTAHYVSIYSDMYRQRYLPVILERTGFVYICTTREEFCKLDSRFTEQEYRHIFKDTWSESLKELLYRFIKITKNPSEPSDWGLVIGASYYNGNVYVNYINGDGYFETLPAQSHVKEYNLKKETFLRSRLYKVYRTGKLFSYAQKARADWAEREVRTSMHHTIFDNYFLPVPDLLTSCKQ